jgi:hypothetical protein
VTVSGKNVQLKDRGCVAMPLTEELYEGNDNAEAGSAAVAMLRVCAAGPLVLVCRVSRVKVAPSTYTAVALSVVAAGDLTLRDSAAEGVRGGTAVHLAAGGDIRVLNSTFVGNHAAATDRFKYDYWPVGGGLAVVASEGTRLVAFQGNAFQGNVAGKGGGAWVDLRAVQPGARCVLAGANRFEGCHSVVLLNGCGQDTGDSGDGGGMWVDARSTAGVAVDVAGAAFFGGHNVTTALVVVMTATTGGRVTVHGDALFVNNTYGGAFLGFYNSSAGTATIAGNASFQGNRKAGDGAAALVDFTTSSGGTATIGGNASFQGNAARDGGGALLLGFDQSSGGVATISGNASFHANTADKKGGAVSLPFLYSSAGAATVVGNATFHGNTAGYEGGAVNVGFHGSVAGVATIAGNASFLENASANEGGAVYLQFFGSLGGVASIAGNTSFQGNANHSGGGVYFQAGDANSSVTIGGNASFLRNTANSSGGGADLYVSLSCISCAAAIVGMAQFVNNSARGQGGGAAIDLSGDTNCSATIAGTTTFVGNNADMGGGAWVLMTDADAAQLRVEAATFVNNTASSGGGGFIVLANTSREASISVRHSQFRGNTVGQGSGGGLVVIAGPPTSMLNNTVLFNITNTTFTNNTVRSGTGGGLHVEGTSNLAGNCSYHGITDCPRAANLRGIKFEGNTATLGGGMFAINTQCIINSSTFASNVASQAGGGAFIKGVTSIILREVRFSSNRCGPEQAARQWRQARSVYLITTLCDGSLVHLSGHPKLQSSGILHVGNTHVADQLAEPGVR